MKFVLKKKSHIRCSLPRYAVDLSAFGAGEVNEAQAQSAQLSLAVEGDGGLQGVLGDVEDNVVLLVVLGYFHLVFLFWGRIAARNWLINLG